MGIKDRLEGPSGLAQKKSTIDYWSRRAERNSEIAPRASDGPMKMAVGSGNGVEQKARGGNAFAHGRADKNHVSDGGDYMPGVRRSAP